MRAVLIIVGLLFLNLPVLADNHARHGMSMFGKLKYPAGFKHFEYVNPNAPKGGLVRLEARGTFDTLNGFTIKGSSAAGFAQKIRYFDSADASTSASNTRSVAHSLTSDREDWPQ